MSRVDCRRIERPDRVALLGLLANPGAIFFEGWSDDGPVTITLPRAEEIVELGWEDLDRVETFLEPVLSGRGRRSCPDGLPFAGGWAGFVSYEAGAALERATPREDVPDEPAAWFARHESGIVTMPDGSAWAFGSTERLDELEALARSAGVARVSTEPSRFAIDDSMGEGRYRASVDDIRERISWGEVYQVNLTRRFLVEAVVDPVALYLGMTGDTPPRCSAFLRGDGWAIASASPEVFLRFDPASGVADSRPIKGTLRRTGDDAMDRAALLASAKDEAEHLMIVDLVRNDLGKVAPTGRVRVAEYKAVRLLAHVLHLESVVEADGLRDDDLPRLMRALFPGGSITGAPKRAAVRVIREVEPCARGVYTGAIGLVDHGGRAEFSVAIRTAVVGETRCRYHAGGGIVWDSDPDAEDRESFDKSIGFLRAFGVET
jgi:anthranilate/para-aminobenzoate synthase component I